MSKCILCDADVDISQDYCPDCTMAIFRLNLGDTMPWIARQELGRLRRGEPPIEPPTDEQVSKAREQAKGNFS